jgi:hypothetical protein
MLLHSMLERESSVVHSNRKWEMTRSVSRVWLWSTNTTQARGPPAMVVDVRSDATRIRALGRGSSEAGHPKFWASGRDVRGGPAPENGRVEQGSKGGPRPATRKKTRT